MAAKKKVVVRRKKVTKAPETFGPGPVLLDLIRKAFPGVTVGPESIIDIRTGQPIPPPLELSPSKREVHPRAGPVKDTARVVDGKLVIADHEFLAFIGNICIDEAEDLRTKLDLSTKLGCGNCPGCKVKKDRFEKLRFVSGLVDDILRPIYGDKQFERAANNLVSQLFNPKE